MRRRSVLAGLVALWTLSAALAGRAAGQDAPAAGTDPREIEASKLVQASIQVADPRQRIDTLRKAISKMPTCAEAHNNLGATYFEMGDFDRAAVSLKRALECEPGMKPVLSNYGAALTGQAAAMPAGKKRTELISAAVATLEDACNMVPEDPAARWHLGVARYHSGSLAEAVADLKRAVALGPRRDAVSPIGRRTAPPKPEELTAGLDRAKVLMLVAGGDEKALRERPVESLVGALERLAVERARLRTRIKDAMDSAKIPEVDSPEFAGWLEASWKGRSQAVTAQEMLGRLDTDGAFGRRVEPAAAAEMKRAALEAMRISTALSLAARDSSGKLSELRSALGELLAHSAEMAVAGAVADRVLLSDVVYGGMHYVE